MIPELTVRKMVELDDGSLEVQRQEPNRLGGKEVSELTIRAVVPREQEAEANEKFQSALNDVIG